MGLNSRLPRSYATVLIYQDSEGYLEMTESGVIGCGSGIYPGNVTEPVPEHGRSVDDVAPLRRKRARKR